jgi:hypothetical protein
MLPPPLRAKRAAAGMRQPMSWLISQRSKAARAARVVVVLGSLLRGARHSFRWCFLLGWRPIAACGAAPRGCSVHADRR